MKVFVIILNYNGKQYTLDCLSSLKKLKIPDGVKFFPLVVDNASKDDSVKTIASRYPDVLLIRNPENFGFAKGNNVGLNKAMEKDADIVIILNNDTVVDDNFLKYFLQGAKDHPKGGIFSPKIYFAAGREFHKDRYEKTDLGKVIWSAGGKIDWKNVYGMNIGIDEVDKGQFNQEKEVEQASGCCLLLTRKCLEDLKGFDENFFMYYEDDDLCIRAKRKKIQVWFIPKAKIWHASAGSSGIGSDLHDYFITRNRLLIGMRYASLRTRLALIKESVRLLFTGRRWQKIGIKDFYLKKFGKGSWR